MTPGDDASSNPMGVVLMVAITIILAALVLIMCLGFFMMPEWKIATIPAIFIVTDVIHTDDVTGAVNYDSRLILMHTGSITYSNTDLKAHVFNNDQPVNCVIETLNGNDFISTVHIGVQWIGGPGCSGSTWLPGESTAIDFTDGTFHPGDRVRIDIIDKSRNEVISRHVYRVH